MTRLPLLAPLLLLATPLSAESPRQLSAHIHGTGALDIAIVGTSVEVELRAPGADIVGFEHPATSDADKAAVAQALDVLSLPNGLFEFSAQAGCSVTEAVAELETDDGDEHAHEHGAHEEESTDEHDAHDHDEAEERAHEHDAHEDETADEHDMHDHDEADKHDHEHDADEASPQHSAFHARAALTCDHPENLKQIAFPYFTLFPSAERLEVRVISDKGGSSASVLRSEPVLDLDGRI